MQGFLVGTVQGSVGLVEKDEENSYKLAHCQAVDSKACIRSLLWLSEDNFAILTSSGELLRASTSTGKNKVITLLFLTNTHPKTPPSYR